MRKVLKVILQIFISYCLLSCDPGTGERHFIDNRTDYDIIAWIASEPKDSILIESKSKVMIQESYDTGATTDLGEDFLNDFFDTLYVTINDKIILNKDIQERANWSFEITDNSGIMNAGIGEYTFEINSSDLSYRD